MYFFFFALMYFLRPSHLKFVQEHKKNTDRIGCFGNMFVIVEGGVLVRIPCDHEPTCMKLLLKQFKPYVPPE
jgi:hypothetical protein